MLSYIYQLAYRFERVHVLQPNTLYLNSDHFDHLRSDFTDPDDINAIAHYLGLQLILSHDAVRPQVAYLERQWRRPSVTEKFSSPSQKIRNVGGH